MITGTKQGCLYWWPQPVAAASSHNGMLHYLIRVGLSGFSRLFFKQMNPRGSVRRADRIVVLWMPIYWGGEVDIYNPHNRISFAFQVKSGAAKPGIERLLLCICSSPDRTVLSCLYNARCNQTVSDSRIFSSYPFPVPFPYSVCTCLVSFSSLKCSS